MLPLCGHSICRKCLNEKPKKEEFECPLCQKRYIINETNQFPINESLLHMISFLKKKKKKKKTPKSAKLLQKISSRNINLN